MAATSIDDALADRLQREVRRLKTRAGRRRAMPTLLNVGLLDGERVVVPIDVVAMVDADHGLRADLLTRALDRLSDPTLRSVWLTRAGALVVGEQDLLWRAAAETAFARHGAADPGRSACFVVTRHGWLDVREETGRSWPRLRPGEPGGQREDAIRLDEHGSWPLVR